MCILKKLILKPSFWIINNFRWKSSKDNAVDFLGTKFLFRSFENFKILF